MPPEDGIIARSRLLARVACAGLTHALRPRIRQVILHVTKRCNLRCRHCFVDFSEIPADLSLGEMREVAGTVGRLLWLDIGGGEPFLREDLAEIVSLFEFEEVSIPTNGWFTDRTVLSAGRLAERFGPKLTLLLSVDGPRRTHDEIRARPGSFERALATFARLRAIPGLRVAFLSTLCERNAAELPGLIESLSSLGPDYHAVNILRGSPMDPGFRLEAAQARRFWRFLQEHYRTRGYGKRRGVASLPLRYVRLRWEASLRTLEERRQVIPCLGGSATLVVHPDGGVGPCETLPPVDSIRRRPLAGILGSAQWEETVRAIRARECHCTHECNLKSSILLNPSLYAPLALGVSSASSMLRKYSSQV